MIFGMSTETFTLLHVLVSLVGIVVGAIALVGQLNGKRLDRVTAVFLAATVLTSITGFGFPVEHVLPSHIVGMISLAVLAIAIAARYGFALRGPWRWIHVVTAAMALYLNVFVGVVQSFLKIAPLKALAPTQQEPPFVAAQLAVLATFIALTTLAVKRFRPQT